jgi:hypothetical protein
MTIMNMTKQQADAGIAPGADQPSPGYGAARTGAPRQTGKSGNTPGTKTGAPVITLRKQRADAKWNLLNDEQRELLEQWLFEERISFDAALDRAQQELGFQGSISSIRRFHEHVAGERTFRNLVVSQEQIEQLGNAPVSTASMRAAGMKVVAQLFFSAVVQSPERVREWSGMARLLLQSESNEIKYRLKQEENEIRRQELAFAREKFHFDVMEKAQKALPELQALAEANLPRYEKNRRMNALRRSVFGPRIPEPLPESEEEEAEMARQKVIDDAERAKQHEWWMRTFGHLRGIKNEKLKMQNETECSDSSSSAEAVEEGSVQCSAEEKEANIEDSTVLPDGHHAEHRMEEKAEDPNIEDSTLVLLRQAAARQDAEYRTMKERPRTITSTNGTDEYDRSTEQRMKERETMAASGVVERGVVYPYGQ